MLVLSCRQLFPSSHWALSASGTTPSWQYCLVGYYFLLVIGHCRLVEPALVSSHCLALLASVNGPSWQYCLVGYHFLLVIGHCRLVEPALVSSHCLALLASVTSPSCRVFVVITLLISRRWGLVSTLITLCHYITGSAHWPHKT